MAAWTNTTGPGALDLLPYHRRVKALAWAMLRHEGEMPSLSAPTHTQQMKLFGEGIKLLDRMVNAYFVPVANVLIEVVTMGKVRGFFRTNPETAPTPSKPAPHDLRRPLVRGSLMPRPNVPEWHPDFVPTDDPRIGVSYLLRMEETPRDISDYRGAA